MRERARRGDVTVTSACLSALKSWRRWRRLLGAAEGRSEAFFLQTPWDMTKRPRRLSVRTASLFLTDFFKLTRAGKSGRVPLGSLGCVLTEASNPGSALHLTTTTTVSCGG